MLNVNGMNLQQGQNSYMLCSLSWQFHLTNNKQTTYELCHLANVTADILVQVQLTTATDAALTAWAHT